MKVYFIGQKGIPARGGGVERHVEELATRLAAKKHDVFVYARKRYTSSSAASYKGVNILYTPAVYTKHLEAISHTFLSIVDLIRHDADIIHVHAIGPSLLLPLIRLIKPRTRVVATIHCADYNHQKWGGFARFSLKLGEKFAALFSDSAITVSRVLQKQIEARYKTKPAYIPNGVAIPELGNTAEPLKTWGLESGEYIVAISRLIRHKGVHFLIEAFKQIETNKKLVIVGGTEYTDDYVRELRQLAKEDDRIIFTGKQSGENLHSLFEHAYCFVHPSLSEGLSIALLEALSYNQAVLASDIPENKEVVDKVGMQFKAGDTADLRDKLSFLLQDPEATTRLKELGRAHVMRHYNWEKITNETIDHYEALCAKKSRRLMKTIKQPS